MDLWDNATNFLCAKVANSSSGSYLLSDVIGLAYKWGVKIKANRASVHHALNELLANYRESNPDSNVYTLVTKLKEVKKFENLSYDLKSYLFKESVLFVGKASSKIEELSKVLEVQDQQIRILRERSGMSNSPGPVPQRSHSSTRARSRMRRQQLANELTLPEEDEDIGTADDLAEDWRLAFEKMTQQISEQKKSITKLSKLCLGSLSAVDKLETQINEGKQNGYHDTSGRTDDRMNKLESEINKLSKLYRGTVDVIDRLTEAREIGGTKNENQNRENERIMRLEEDNNSLQNHISKIETKIDRINKNSENGQLKSDYPIMSKEDVEQILDEFWQKNLEHFIQKSEWEERSSYWEEKFTQELNSIVSDVKEVESQNNCSKKLIQEMLEKVNKNLAETSNRVEKTNLEMDKKFEDVKRHYLVLESTSSILQDELKQCHNEQIKKLELEQKCRESGEVHLKSSLTQHKEMLEGMLQEKIRQSDKSVAEKVSAIKKTADTIKAEVSTNRDNWSSEAEILKRNLINIETKVSQVEDKDSKIIENLTGRMANCEKSLKDVASKISPDLDQRVKTVAKSIDDHSSQIATLRTQVTALENIGQKAINVELKSKIETIEKKNLERKEDIEAMMKSNSDLIKNLESVKNNLKQVDVLSGKISNLEKSNFQISKDFTKMDSLQKSLDSNEKSTTATIKLCEALGSEIEKVNVKVNDINAKNFQSKIENVESRLEGKLESVLKKSNEGNSVLNEKVSSLDKTLSELNKDFQKRMNSTKDELMKKCDEKHASAQADLKEVKNENSKLEKSFKQLKENTISNSEVKKSFEEIKLEIQTRIAENKSEFKSKIDELKIEFTNKIIDSATETNTLKEAFDKSQKTFEDLGSKVRDLASETGLTRSDLRTCQEDLNRESFQIREKVEAAIEKNEHFKEQFEIQLMTLVELKLKQLENSLEEDLKKLEGETLDHKTSILEIGSTFEKNLNYLKSNFADEIKTIKSNLESGLKSESQKIELRLFDLQISHDLFNNIEKEQAALAQRMKNLASKADLDQTKSQLDKLAAKTDHDLSEMNQKHSRLETVLGDVEITTSNLSHLTKENNSRHSTLMSSVGNLQEDIDGLRESLSQLNTKVGEVKLNQVEFETRSQNEHLSIIEQLAEKTLKCQDSNKSIEQKMSEFEELLKQLESNAETDRLKIYAEIHSNVKNLNENLRHRFEDFSHKFDDLERYCNVIEGISCALDRLKSDLSNLSTAVGKVDVVEKQFIGELHTFSDQMAKNSVQVGQLRAKMDTKEKEMSTISQKVEDLKKEFFHFSVRIDGSESNLWSDICTLTEKLTQFESELNQNTEEWKKSQNVTLERMQQINESIKVSDELNECYKERDYRKIEDLEVQISEDRSVLQEIRCQLAEIENFRSKNDFVSMLSNFENNFARVMENIKLNQTSILDLKHCFNELETIKRKLNALENERCF